MNNVYLQLAIGLTVSLVLSLLMIPCVIAVSVKFKLFDQPNARKVHQKAISRLGGVAIFFSAFSAVAISRIGLDIIRVCPVLVTSVGLIFLLGVWDDLMEVNAKLRFIIQICLAISLAASGIRLTSLYGICGIHELSGAWQYIVTVLIIVGSTNAFNLIDGVDGLAGGLGLIGMLVLGILAWQLKLYPLVILLSAFVGALLGFLKSNLSPARIFMGDGGSLILGFLLSATGILLIGQAHRCPGLVEPSKAAILVTAILIIPMFDTWRVFASRIMRGVSPFKADKTHLHHLLLFAGFDHRKTSFSLYFFEIVLVLLALLFSHFKGVSVVILLMVGLSHALTLVLRINKGMERWLAFIRKMELE